MIYAISFVVYAIVFCAGFYLVKKQPKNVERLVGKVAFIGFCLQIAINYMLKDSAVFYDFISSTHSHRSSINFLFLCLVSIFCYASLLVVLYKSNDFYNDESN